MGSSHRISVCLAAWAAALALASCGGESAPAGGAASTTRPAFDPDTVVEQAAGPNRAARTGRIDAKVSFTLQGVPAGYREFAAGVSGPYRYRKDASLPDYELEIGARDYGIELTSVRGRSYVSLGSTGYPLPADVRRRLVRSAAKGRNGLTRTLEQFGIAPWRWETERVAAGTARLDGVEVRHVTTGANVGRILRDANTLLGLCARWASPARSACPTRSGRPRGARSPAGADVRGRFVGRDEGQGAAPLALRDDVRGAEGPPGSRGGITGGRVAAELNVTQVGRPQRIAAPATLGSFADFAVGLDALGDAQDGG